MWRRRAARTRAPELLPHLQSLSFDLAREFKPGLVTGVGYGNCCIDIFHF